MNRLKILLSLIVSASALNAQKETRPLQRYDRIDVSGEAKVYYTHTDTAFFRLESENGDLSKVETRFENGTLFIFQKGKNEEETKVLLGGNSLRSVSATGASSFRSKNSIIADSLSVQASGAANIRLVSESKKLNCGATGAANITLEGKTVFLDAVAGGASTVKSYDLAAKQVNVEASGASTAKVYASEKINARASGASSIKIKGEVKDLSAESTSAASITRILDGNENVKANGDSTTIHWKGKKVIIIEGRDDKKKKRIAMDGTFDHWAGFSMGVNGYLTPANQMGLPASQNYMDLNYSRSLNVQLNLFQKNIHLYKNYVNLVTGLGFEWRRYMLDRKVTLDPDSSFTWGSFDSTNTFKYNKNLFKSSMLQVPLLLEFNTSKKANRSFHVAMGVIGQFMLTSKTKQILEAKGDEFTKIHKDTYNMMPWSAKAHLSLGYSQFTAFAEYNITPLFEKKEGPVLFPFTAGVRIIPFSE